MKKRKTSESYGPDQIWHQLRSPFRYPKAGHTCQWERYDADRAGCLLCGDIHRCPDSMMNCKCTLVESDDGGHVCVITGLYIREVRVGAAEYVDHVVFEQHKEFSYEDSSMHERVHAIVYWLLTSNYTADCRRLERGKYVQKTRQIFLRVLKQKKAESPFTLPCLCQVVAEVAQAEQLINHQCRDCEPSLAVIERVVQQSAACITSCLRQIHTMGFKKTLHGNKFQSMVVGMLYMCRKGLKVGDLFHLPVVRGMQDLLPSETYLNSLGVCNKVICDTENEIKSCIRAFGNKNKKRPRP